jgi:hypothetical protein
VQNFSDRTWLEEPGGALAQLIARYPLAIVYLLSSIAMTNYATDSSLSVD